LLEFILKIKAGIPNFDKYSGKQSDIFEVKEIKRFL